MNLLSMLPPSYQAGPEMAEIQRVIGAFVDRLMADLERLKAQLDIETATTGLVGWERAVGIQTDLTQSLDWRRSKIKAKLQGLSVTTPAVIAAIVSRFTGGDAYVEEYPSQYLIKVVAEGLLNPPENMSSLRHAVAEVKPAHLAHEYVLSYQTGALPVGCAVVMQVAENYNFEVGDVT